MDSIYHEKQEGYLCAQHCLNNLLQGAYFTAVDLAGFARELDEQEWSAMIEGDVSSELLKKIAQRPSTNMDDTGYFSIQVINRALQIWNLELIPITSEQTKHVMENPVDQRAFICNHQQHWLTVRKLGKQWFNLDSLLKKPKLVSDTYLSLFLTQLQLEGYSIFVVSGELPCCEADQLFQVLIVTDTNDERAHYRTDKATSYHKTISSSSSNDQFELELATAMSASMEASSACSTEETRQRRLMYFEKYQDSGKH